MSVSSTVNGQSSPLTTRLYAPTPNTSDYQWTQDNSVLTTTNSQWSEAPPPEYKVYPMANFTDANGGLMNSKMNIVSSTSYYNGQDINNTFLPTCQRDILNTNGICGNNPIRPPLLGVMNTPIMVPCQRNGPSIPQRNWNSHGTTERYNRPIWVPPKAANGVKKHKRVRTAFTSHQMMELEQEYARTRYLDRARRIELAETLVLNERTIKIWFQNRRMKEKKDRAENYDDSEEPSTTDSSPEMISKVMPVHTHEHFSMQCNAPNGVYHQGSNYYVEQYPSTPITLMPQLPMYQMNIPQEPQRMVQESYPISGLDSNVDVGLKFEPLQPNLLKTEPFEPCESNETYSLDGSPAHSDISAIDSGKSDINEQNWDLSWIKSINFQDEA
ncbi:homeobox protein HOX3 [Papilio machaon]|uniref:homeobox protein HOX3 n=1 Tax=Papilio machaon TaxID=76193 RepID=UPI001E663EC3|nr:homeobox protein HOX3 [Papilio machaon]